jgi:transposase InsO family protein
MRIQALFGGLNRPLRFRPDAYSNNGTSIIGFAVRIEEHIGVNDGIARIKNGLLRLAKADGRPLPLYLTTALDLADRKVVGWGLSDSLKAADTSVA